MGRWLAIPVALLLACGEPSEVPDPPEGQIEHPNVVLIIADDHGYPYFGFTGSEIVKTPNLDRLAAEGTVFTQGFATSNVCRPSMWTLLNGLYPLQMNVLAARRAQGTARAESLRLWQRWAEHYVDVVRADAHTLPRALARAGYVSFQGGKYWEGTFDVAGFDEGMSARLGGSRRHEDESSAQWVHRVGRILRVTLHPVLDFIDRNRERPFFVWYAPLLPHEPHNPPVEHLAKYPDRRLSESARAYYAMCSWFDEEVGKLLAQLERSGLREKTLVVFASDNGWHQDPDVEESPPLGGPLGKLSHHELAFRTPIILSWPGRIPAGRVRSDLVSTADLYPTILGYAGLEVPRSRRGRDLRPLLGDGSARTRSYLIGSTTFARRPELDPEARSVPWTREAVFHVTGADWHYVYNETRRQERLYDRPSDPRAARDRIAAHPEIARRYRGQIDAWKSELIEALDLPD